MSSIGETEMLLDLGLVKTELKFVVGQNTPN